MKRTNLHKIFDTDEKLEVDGKWFEISPGVEFLIKRDGGRNRFKNQIALSKAYAPYREKLDNGELTNDENQAIINKVFIETCVVDWRGLEDDDGPIKFSLEECMELFKQLPEVKDEVIRLASLRRNYLKEESGK